VDLPDAAKGEQVDARPDDHVIVVFGATGDLARRDLLPGLFHLAKAGLLPARYRIVGSARSALTDDGFRRLAEEAGGRRRPDRLGASSPTRCRSAPPGRHSRSRCSTR
jgi:hypothetical protein